MFKLEAKLLACGPIRWLKLRFKKWLATNPGKLDGIIIQSASELGALEHCSNPPRHDSNHNRF